MCKYLPRDYHQAALYLVYKQEYLELVENNERDAAFAHLGKRIKPLELYIRANHPKHFGDICYLLTCSAVHDAPSFRHWGGIEASRLSLINDLQNALLNASAVVLSCVEIQRTRKSMPAVSRSHQTRRSSAIISGLRVVRLSRMCTTDMLSHQRRTDRPRTRSRKVCSE